MNGYKVCQIKENLDIAGVGISEFYPKSVRDGKNLSQK